MFRNFQWSSKIMAQSLMSLIITQLMDVVAFQEHMLFQLIVKSYEKRDTMFLTMFVIFDFHYKIMNILWVFEIFEVVDHVLLDFSWLSFESLFPTSLAIWSVMFFSTRKLYFLMTRSGANYVKIRFFLRSTNGLFFIELLYPFTEWLIRYDSELKIGFITKIMSSFLLDCFLSSRFTPSLHTKDVVTIILFVEDIETEMHNFVFDFSWVCPNVRQVLLYHAFQVRFIMSNIHMLDVRSWYEELLIVSTYSLLILELR